MTYRFATTEDAALLARLNQQLIQDEGHRNSMTLLELKERMVRWVGGDYQAVLFERDGNALGYALFRREPEFVYVRQFFVGRDHRRAGIGREAIDWLRRNVWTDAPRVRIEVLTGNAVGIAFWRSVGFRDYSITMEISEAVDAGL